MQQQFNRVGKAELGSVALPAIMRTGAGGPENFQVGTMPQPQLQITSGQMHRGHMPPLVSSPCARRRAQTPEGAHQACVDPSVLGPWPGVGLLWRAGAQCRWPPVLAGLAELTSSCTRSADLSYTLAFSLGP